jgi:uncharacterized membrane protein
MDTASRSLTDLRNFEALSHGVFAIAITLLVLDIRVPPVETTADGAALIGSLTAGWPRYLAYVLGFMYIGEYWLASNRTMRLMRASDHWLLAFGLLYLMAIAGVPFVTSLLAEYISQDGGRDQVALTVFTGWMLLLAVLGNLSLQYAAYRDRLIRPDVDRRALATWMRIGALGVVIWIVALAAAMFASSTVTLVLDVAILLVFLRDVPIGMTGAPAADLDD